jgi:hypothetical protein
MGTFKLKAWRRQSLISKEGGSHTAVLVALPVTEAVTLLKKTTGQRRGCLFLLFFPSIKERVVPE